jgi:hypothetical protein
MSYPVPVWNPAVTAWQVDLRTPWRLGRHLLRCAPPPAGLGEAINGARDLLERLRRERGLTDPQLALPMGRTLAAVLPAFLKEKKWRSEGGKRWTVETCDLLTAELGSTALLDLTVDALWAYRDRVRATVGPKAMQSRLIVLAQLLTWSSEPPRKWVPFVPPMPSPKLGEDEVIRNALTKWVDHGTFRAARDRIYEHHVARSALARELRAAGLPDGADAVRDWIERRKLYLSFAFYTGMRRHDLDLVDDSCLSLDFDCYFRHGRKTGVAVAAESICKPFAQDLAAFRARLRRPFASGERICGGPWKNSCRVLWQAAKVAGVQAFNLMDCRRSFVYHKALARVPEGELVNLMGHKDSRMIHGVYLLLQPRLQRNEAGAAWPDDLVSVPGTGTARVLPFTR